MKKPLLLGCKILVSAGLIWAIYRHIDFPTARAHMAAASATVMAGAMVLCVGVQWLNAWRWQLVLEVCGYRIGFGRLVAHTFVGFFFSQATPSTIGGDGVRAWLACSDGATPSQAIRSVLIERLFGFAVMVLLAAVGLPWLLAKAGPQFNLWAAEVVVFVAFALGILALMLLQRSIWLQRNRLGRGVHAMAADIWTILARPKTTTLVTMLSLLSQILICATVWAIGIAIGSGWTLIDALIVMPGVLILTTVPISIAGWGVREGIMLIALGLVGVSPSDAVAISVLFGLVCLTVGLAGGGVWLLERHRNWLQGGMDELSTSAFSNNAMQPPEVPVLRQ